MSMTCSVCRNPDRNAIDEALLRSDSFRHIAAQHSVSTTALQRHKNACISAQLAKAKDLQETDRASDLVGRLREIHVETKAILAVAKKSKDWPTALRAIGRLEAQIELEADLLGTLASREAEARGKQVVNIFMSESDMNLLR